MKVPEVSADDVDEYMAEIQDDIDDLKSKCHPMLTPQWLRQLKHSFSNSNCGGPKWPISYFLALQRMLLHSPARLTLFPSSTAL